MSELKPFAGQGHYTEIHDAVFDVVMPMCPPNAWKILCFVLRKTKGWRKESDTLSYTQIRKGCGISSDATVRKALEWLTHEDHRLLNAETGKDKAGRQQTTLYALNRNYTIEKPTTENEQPTTESEDGFATETVDGPTTETVETITTLQYPHSNNQKREEENTSSSHSAKPKAKKLKVSDDEAERRWGALISEDENAALLQEFAEFTANCTKAGERKVATLWRQIGKPYLDAKKKHDARALAAGLGECIRREKPDVRYAVGVARNWTPDNVRRLRSRTENRDIPEEAYDREAY